MGKIKTFKGKTKLKNELKIKLSDIMKIQRFEMAIFENDDGFPADYRGSIEKKSFTKFFQRQLKMLISKTKLEE